MTRDEIERYTEVIIPNIERDLLTVDGEGAMELYTLYEDVLRLVAPYNFEVFNKYLELDEDHSNPNKAFYHHRKDHMGEVFKAFNDMEMYDAYDTLIIMMPPRVGKTTTELRFMSWIIGKYPEETQLTTSYSDNITTSFYIGVMEVIQSARFQHVFPDAKLVAQNAKREEIWLKVLKRYPSILFIPIGGSMTGRSEASRYVFCDDLVSGIEEALSLVRLGNLWQKYSVNVRQRKKDGCKEVHVATPWSVHDPISRLAVEHADNPRCKILKLSCYDEHGESNFDFAGGFSTAYYNDLENGMDEITFGALYKQEPIEREGLLYHKEDLSYFFETPDEKPDTIIAVCDSKNLGKDNVSAIVGEVYDNTVYITDIVYDQSLPEITTHRVAELFIRNNVVRADVELNNGGNFYAQFIDDKIRASGGRTSIRIFFSSNNKNVKIVTYSDFVKTTFVFKDPSTYHAKSDYARFMADMFKWTQIGKNPFDDAPDSVAMLAQLFQDLSGMSVKVLDRKTLRI